MFISGVIIKETREFDFFVYGMVLGMVAFSNNLKIKQVSSTLDVELYGKGTMHSMCPAPLRANCHKARVRDPRPEICPVVLGLFMLSRWN